MSCDEIDFSFIENVGKKVSEIILNDPDQVDWFYSIIDEYNNNLQYPPDLIFDVIDYLTSLKDEGNLELIKDIKAIIQDENNTDNLLAYIFSPAFNEEEEEAEDLQDDSTQPISFEVEKEAEEEDKFEIDFKNLSTEGYFDYTIKKIMQILYVSHDIAYLLCRKFNLNQEIIIQKWVSSQDEIFKKLRIKIGSDTVPDLKSPLEIKSCGVGECPICFCEYELFQLYCGHKLCKECLTQEMEQMISTNQVPICRQTDDDSSQQCGSEIMLSDIHHFLRDELFEKCKKIIFSSDISLYKSVRNCPNDYCNSIITSLNEIPCHVGICPQCSSAVCLKCKGEVHAPLLDCGQVDDFLVTLSESMSDLQIRQKKWLSGKHIGTQNQYMTYTNQEVAAVKEKWKKKKSEVDKRIGELTIEIDKLKSDILAILKEAGKKELSPSESHKIDSQVTNMKNEINQKKIIIKNCQETQKNNKEQLQKELDFYKKENQHFAKIANNKNNSASLNFQELEVTMNEHAMSRIKFISNDWIKKKQETLAEEVSNESVILNVFKRCPKCKTPIERVIGCHHMTCMICRTEFCYICGGLWDYHVNYMCPKMAEMNELENKKRKIKNKNKEDLQPDILPPMNIEKRVDFLRWNNAHSLYLAQKAKYEELFKDFNNKKDIRKGATIELCTRNKIAKQLLCFMERSEVKMKTYSIMNSVLFAQSVIMWGYPALYYMMSKPEKAMLFEYKLVILEKTKDNVVEFLHDLKNSPLETFDTKINSLKRQVYDILSMAEAF